MFTGIIASKGAISKVADINGGVEIEVQCDGFFEESKLGDSVAINGVCLTVTKLSQDRATFFSQVETNSKTTTGFLEIGDTVNLEHPLRFSDRLGGHLVQGHVDGVVTIDKVEDIADGSKLVSIGLIPEMSKYIADRGSVTLNGVSLTVASKRKDAFSVALIPMTLDKTTFDNSKVGDRLNIELDCIARYVDQLLNS